MDDLRFSPAEAAEFLNARLGLGLAPADVAGLVARTEGWPAGLYLAALSLLPLAGAADRHAFVAGFGASHRHVVDFLSREVLDTHAPALQDLMLRASVLESVCGSLGDALTGRPGTAALLDELAATNLFLLPLDDRREWFRFHHLFAELLRVELGRRAPDLAPELHRRASRWYRDHGLPGPGDRPRPRGRRVRGGGRAARGGLAGLHERLPARHRAGLARPLPRRGPGGPGDAAPGQGLGPGAGGAGRRGAARRRDRRRARRAAGDRGASPGRGRCRTASARSARA